MPDSLSGPDPISSTLPALPLSLHPHHIPHPSDLPDDTITLSASAQITQLNAMGDTPEIIAQSLALPLSQVNVDLGITITPTPPPVVASVIATQLK